MRLPFVCLYVVSGFFAFALHAHTLDAPTLVVQEYNENFLKKANVGAQIPAVRVVRQYLAKHMRDVPPAKVARLSRLIVKLSRRHNFPPGLILSVIRVESNFQPWAVSPVGALGLMQIMPETGQWLAQRYGMKWEGPAMLLDEEINITMGVRYLAYLRDKYGGDLQKILTAYNKGPGRVDVDVAKGRSVASGYYYKVKEYFPKLALAPQGLAKNQNVYFD